MSDLARSVCKQVVTSLHQRVGEARAFGIMPNDRDWMEKFLILFALGDCQSSFQTSGQKQKPICRFSMGTSTDLARAKLQEYLKNLRATRLKQKYNKVAASLLHESQVDFSLSNYSLPQAAGDARAVPMPKDAHFELLMIAESEMGSKQQVLDDFLKLPSMYCNFKVMIYRVPKRAKDRLALKQGFERIVKIARKPHDTAEWLFVGVPGYQEWIIAWDDPSKLTKNVYYLPSKATALELHDDWWIWPD